MSTTSAYDPAVTDLERADQLLAEIRAGGTWATADFSAIDAARDALAASRPSAPTRGFNRRYVYYIRRATDGAIKIGSSSSSPDTRVKQLARTYGRLELLTYELSEVYAGEQRRHEQFASDRLAPDPRPGGTEWFHPSPELIAHIEDLRNKSERAR